MADRDLTAILAVEAGRFFKPLYDAVSVSDPALAAELDPPDPVSERIAGLQVFLRRAGLDDLVDLVSVSDIQTTAEALATTLEGVMSATEVLVEALRNGRPSASPVQSLFQAARSAYTQVEDLKNFLNVIDPAARPADLDAATIGRRIVDMMVVLYVEGYHPRTDVVARLLGILQGTGSIVPLGQEVERPSTHPERIGEILSDPAEGMLSLLGLGDDPEPTLFLSRVASLLGRLGIDTSFAAGPIPGAETAGLPPELVLAVPLVETIDPSTGDPISMGVALAARSEQGAEAILVGTYGSIGAGWTETFGGGWTATVEADASFDDIAMLRIAATGDVERFDRRDPGGATVPATARLALDKDTSAEPLLRLGELASLSAGSLRVALELDARDRLDASVSVGLKDGRLLVSSEEADGFLAQLLKGQSVEAPLDTALRWSSRDGLTFEGSASFNIDLPVGASIGGVVNLETVHLSTALGTQDHRFDVAITGGARLGPFQTSIARMGLRSELALAGAAVPAAIAGLGSLGLGLAFKPPNGLGLGLDLGPVAGDGFLDINVEAGRYAGALQLKAEMVNLSAFGVILTKMPDGGDSFSMLAFVRGEFAPIQLGFGFTLNAVGGLLGIHRDLDAEALFAAVRAGRAGDLLAPEDPIRDAPTLIAQAETIFPPRRGRHVFGPTMQVGWGAPRSLITLDLALALTMPEPLRIFLIGRVRAVLPDETVKLIALNLDVAGVLDLSRGMFDLEGRLFDSVIQAIPITGGFAMKTAWGAKRSFIFSVGGLHPRFAPPTGFPVLPRAGVDLSRSAAFTLRLSAYFAVSSNSLQLGAAVDLLAKLGKFGLEAHLGFDALLIFDPFELDAELRASARIFRDSRTLMRLALKARLRGPGPWRINGSVTFEIFWVDVTLRVSKSFGTPAPRDSPRVALVPIFEAALKAPANWASEGTGPLILARGATGLVPGRTLIFSQRNLPLDLDLEQYGGLEIADRRRFGIAGVEMGGRTATPAASPPREAFAVGSVLKLSEDERLVAPDFQDLPSGIGIEGVGIVDDGTQAEAPAGRRVLRIDVRSGKNPPSPYSEEDEWKPPAVTLARAKAGRAAIVIRPERWMAGPVDAPTAGPFDSWAEARAASPDGTVSRRHEGRAA